MPQTSRKSQKSDKHDKAKHSGKLHVQAHKGGAGGKGTWGSAADDIKYGQSNDVIDQNDPNYEPADAVDDQQEAPPPPEPVIVIESEGSKIAPKLLQGQAPEIAQPAQPLPKPPIAPRDSGPKRKWIKKVSGGEDQKQEQSESVQKKDKPRAKDSAKRRDDARKSDTARDKGPKASNKPQKVREEKGRSRDKTRSSRDKQAERRNDEETQPREKAGKPRGEKSNKPSRADKPSVRTDKAETGGRKAKQGEPRPDRRDSKHGSRQTSLHSRSRWFPTEEKKKRFATSLHDFANFKKQIKLSTEEYLVSFNVKDFEHTIKELDLSVFHQDIPAIVIKLGMDKNQQERTKLAELLHELFKRKYISPNQMAQGFRKIYNNLNDLLLDIPNAKTLISEFVQHGVTSGYLDADVAKEMQVEAELLADGEGLLKIKKAIDSCIQEFFSCCSVEEAVRSVAEVVPGPHYQFEVVKRFVSTALDRSDKERELTSLFLSAAAGRVIQHDQMAKGFSVLLHRVEDLHKDVPEVLRLLSCFIARAVADEVLPPAFLLRVDLSGGDMGCQVVQQAEVLLQHPAGSEALSKVWLGVSVKQVMASILALTTQDKLEVLRQLQALVE